MSMNIASTKQFSRLNGLATQALSNLTDLSNKVLLRAGPLMILRVRQVEGHQFQIIAVISFEPHSYMVPAEVARERFNHLVPNLGRFEQASNGQTVFIDRLQLRQAALCLFKQARVRNGGGSHGGKGLEQLQVSRLE